MSTSTTQQQSIVTNLQSPSVINSDVIWSHVSMILINKLNLSMNNFNTKTVMKLILIVCLFEIKVGFIDLMKYLKKNSKTWIIDFYNFIIARVKCIINKLRYRKKFENNNCNDLVCKYQTYKINISNDTKNLLIKFIENKKHSGYVTFMKRLDSTIDYTSSNVNMNNIYSDVRIKLNDCLFEFCNNIHSHSSSSSSSSFSSSFLNNKIIVIDVKNYNEGISGILGSDLYYKFENFIKMSDIRINSFIFNQYIDDNNIITKCYFRDILIFLNLVYTEYHIYPLHTSYIGVYIYSLYLYFGKSDKSCIYPFIKNVYDNLINFNTLITPFGVSINFDNFIKTRLPTISFSQKMNALKKESPTIIFCEMEHIVHNSNLGNNQLAVVYNHFVENVLKKCDTNKNADTDIKNNNNLTFDVNVLNENEELSDEEQIKNLIENISKETQNSNVVSTFAIKIIEKEVIEEVDNPEYLKYEENKEMIEKMIAKSDKIDCIMSIPDKKLKIKKINKTIDSIKIKDGQKSFNTLYLQQNDEKRLLQILENYNSNVFEEFELPKKLGIMLYGEPGTGKSTTIQVIASFLKKNIYYVNISGIKTCGELKNIFDYVVTNCNGSGIIVFEDIDAQTPIVHRRVVSQSEIDNSETNVTSFVDGVDEKLNLAYFLNLLDGSLCAKDTMFIMTTNHIEKLDPAIYRHGRIDCRIELKPCDHYQIQKIYKTILKEEIDIAILHKIPEYKYTPSEIIYWLANCLYNKSDCETMMKKFIEN